MEQIRKYSAAVVQASPVFLDKKATVEKACTLIKEAGINGAKVIVFPETFIPTYPYWMRDLVDREPCYDVFVDYFHNSVTVPGKETEILAKAAKDAGVWVIVGISEAAGGTLYNSNLYISADGQVLGTHRKLLPTFTERAIWGNGDGSTLHVFNSPYGKIGSLVCYEHHMPLTKFTMYSKGEQVHGASWPGLAHHNHVVDAASRQYAFEGQTFVLASACYIKENEIPKDFPLKDYMMKANGGSAIINPMGICLAGPVYDSETILYAEIDLDIIIKAKYIVDSVGHYCRPDVARLLLNENALIPVVKKYEDKDLVKDLEHYILSGQNNLHELADTLKELLKKLNELTVDEIKSLKRVSGKDK